MGIQHFSGLFVLLCVGVAGALLTLLGEHAFFRFILPHLRHQQRFKYWLHTSQKIHRALNMGCEDDRKSQAESTNRCSTLCLSENCNLHRLPSAVPTSSSPQPSTSSASTSSSTTKWNNQSAKAGREAKDHNKHVHFNLETLNSYQLQAPPPGPERSRRGLVGSPPTQLCSNGGPNLSLSLVLSPPACPGASSPWEEELRELQGRIEECRGQLRAALARRAELQRNLVRQRLSQPQTVSSSNPAETSAPSNTNTLTKDINRGR